MRIISQNGKFDLPYEETTIKVFSDGEVVAFALSDFGCSDYISMAKYSNKEKAMKAMEMCRNRYLSRTELQGGFNALNGSYVQPNIWVLPRVFQFPQDNEVEV